MNYESKDKKESLNAVEALFGCFYSCLLCIRLFILFFFLSISYCSVIWFSCSLSNDSITTILDKKRVKKMACLFIDYAKKKKDIGW